MYVLVKCLFRIAIWPIFGKEIVLLAFCLKCFDCSTVALSVSFFPFRILDGRCKVIVMIPDHCRLPFYINNSNIPSVVDLHASKFYTLESFYNHKVVFVSFAI